MNWQAIIVLALIVEGIVTNLKFLWSKEEFSISRLVALIVSILGVLGAELILEVIYSHLFHYLFQYHL